MRTACSLLKFAVIVVLHVGITFADVTHAKPAQSATVPSMSATKVSNNQSNYNSSVESVSELVVEQSQINQTGIAVETTASSSDLSNNDSDGDTSDNESRIVYTTSEQEKQKTPRKAPTPSIAQRNQQPTKKELADIENIKRNVDQYNKLLAVDKEKLTVQQRNVLERIVDRVARLKETFDISIKDLNAGKERNNGKKRGGVVAKATITTATTPMVLSSSVGDINSSMSIIALSPPSVNTDKSEARAASVNNKQKSHSLSSSLLPSSRPQSPSSSSNNSKIRTTQGSSTKRPLSSSTLTSAATKATLSRASGGPRLPPSKGSSAAGNNSGGTSPAVPVPTASSTANTAGITTSAGSTPSSSTTSVMDNANGQQLHHIRHHQQLPVQPQITQQQLQKLYQQQQLKHKLQDEKNLQQLSSSASSDVNLDTRSTVSSIVASESSFHESNSTSSIISNLANQAREELYAANSNSNNNINNGSNNQGESDKTKKAGVAKPMKYHYYPHNQHIYLLPECAIQQVCNAVYVRLNYTQPLCACPSRYRDPCSASLNEDDQHTTKLIGDGRKKAITLAKTCEATTEMRECRSPKDWSLLALQNTRTGKSHYLVICRCPHHFKLEGPMAHDQPTYASVPGIRVFGMMCVKPGYSLRKATTPTPPKRYHTQRPGYFTTVNKYTSEKEATRPSYAQDSYHSPQQQQQSSLSSYHYLNRPSTSPITNSNIGGLDYNDPITSHFGGIYGRNGQSNTQALPEDAVTPNKERKSNRSRRHLRYNEDSDYVYEPEFHIHRLLEELRKSLGWV